MRILIYVNKSIKRVFCVKNTLNKLSGVQYLQVNIQKLSIFLQDYYRQRFFCSTVFLRKKTEIINVKQR